MSTVNSGTIEVNHEGKEIIALWQLQKDEINEYRYYYTYRIQFDYKNIEVVDFIEKEKAQLYEFVEFMCTILDKLGKDDFNIFKKYYDEIESLSEKYIIINDKIYKPIIDKLSDDGDLHYYYVNMIMNDKKVLNGRTILNEDGMNPFDKEEYNKDILIRNLRFKVKNYYKEYTILPYEKDHLLTEETEKLKSMLKWLDKKYIDLRWLYKD